MTRATRLRRVLATPIYTNSIYLTVNVAVTSGLGFVFWIVVARFYSDAEVGYSSAIISMMTYLAVISLVGLDATIIRYLPRARKPRGLLNSCFTLSGLTAIVAAGIFVLGVGFWSPALAFIRGNFVFALLFLGATPLWALSLLTNAAYLASRHSRFVLIQNAIASVTKILLAMLLVLFFHAFGIVAAWGVAAGVALCLSLFLFLPGVQPGFRAVPALKLGYLKSNWRYSGGNYLVTLFTMAPTLLLPVIVLNRLGPQSNAYFYIAWMMANVLSGIAAAISNALFAEGVHFEDRLGEDVRKTLKFTFMVLVPLVVVLIAGGKWLLLIFGPGYSTTGLGLLQVVALSSLPIGVNYIYTGVLRVRGRLREMTIIWGFIAVATLVVSYLVAPVTGIIGIGYAWLGVHGSVAIYVTVVIRKQLRRGSI